MGSMKPCPGCGKIGRGRPVDKVCKECEKTLAVGRATLEKDTRAGIRRGLWRIRPEGWPSFFNVRSAALGSTMAKLALEALEPYDGPIGAWDDRVKPLPPEGPGITYFSTYDEGAVVCIGRASLAKAIMSLDLVVRSALEASHEDGKGEGQSLLRSIARGDVTIAQLNDETIRGGRRRR